VRATNPKGAVSASYEFAVAQNPTIDPNSPSVRHYARVFAAITALLFILLLVIVIVLVAYMVKGKWSLAGALSEESSYQPKEIVVSQDGQSNVVMVASTSRLIALLGLLGILTTVLGIGYSIIWNLFVYGTVPPLTQVRSFLFGAACLFAPYLANQARAAFEPSAAPAPPPAPAKPTSTATSVISGVSPSKVLANANPQQLRVTGSGFQPNLTVELTDPTGASTNFQGGQVLVEPTLITFNATLGRGGTWKTVLKNPGEDPSGPKTFTVTEKPAIQKHDPADLHVNAGAIPLTLSGTGFQASLTVALTSPSNVVTQVDAKDIVEVKPESVRINVTLNAQGNWMVVVTNPGQNNSEPYTLAVKS
jgi:hypothetical protein